MRFEVLHRSNTISTMKTIGTDQCKLCTDEKIRILKNNRDSGTNLINKCSEVFSACRHQTKFHRFPSHNNGTDETSYSLVERVTSPLPSPTGRTSISTTTTTQNTPPYLRIDSYKILQPLTCTPTNPRTNLSRYSVGPTHPGNHMVITVQYQLKNSNLRIRFSCSSRILYLS